MFSVLIPSYNLSIVKEEMKKIVRVVSKNSSKNSKNCRKRIDKIES